MTSSKLVAGCRLYIPQLLFFITAIMLLPVLNFSGNAVEIKRPSVLLAGSVFALFNFEKSSSFSVITKIILLYIMEMLFNQLSGRLVHVGLFSIHLSLIVVMPLAASFICSRLRQPQITPVDSSNLLINWAFAFAVIILHMSLLFILLKNIYAYGYDHNFAVLANMCLYFLVLFFTWNQLEQITFRRVAALIFTIFFTVIMVRGF